VAERQIALPPEWRGACTGLVNALLGHLAEFGVTRAHRLGGDASTPARNFELKIITPHEGQITALILSLSFGITSDGRGPRCGLWGTSISCLHDQVLAKSMTAMPPDGPASPRKLRQNR